MGLGVCRLRRLGGVLGIDHRLEMVAVLPRMASVWSAYVQMALTFFLSRLVKRGSYRLGWVLQLLIRWF